MSHPAPSCPKTGTSRPPAWVGQLPFRKSAAATDAKAAEATAARTIRFFLWDIKAQDGPPEEACVDEEGAICNNRVYEGLEHTANKPPWERNHGDNQTRIILMGRTQDGFTVTAVLPGFRPWLRVEIPDRWTDSQQTAFVDYVTKATGRVHRGKMPVIRWSENKLPHSFGYEPNPDQPERSRNFRYLKLEFESLAQMGKAKKLLVGEEVTIPGIGPHTYKVVDIMQQPRAHFWNDCGVKPCTWIDVALGSDGTASGRKRRSRVSHDDVEVNVPIGHLTSYRDVVTDARDAKGNPVENLAPVVILSYDAENHSFKKGYMRGKRGFPAVSHGDKTIYIGNNFVVADGNPKPVIHRVIIALGALSQAERRGPSADAPTKIIVHQVATAEEMMEAFRDLKTYAQTEIETGWNIYNHDNVFFYEEHLQRRLRMEQRGGELSQAAIRTKLAMLADEVLVGTKGAGGDSDARVIELRKLLDSPDNYVPSATLVNRCYQELGYNRVQSIMEGLERRKEVGPRFVFEMQRMARIMARRAARDAKAGGGGGKGRQDPSSHSVSSILSMLSAVADAAKPPTTPSDGKGSSGLASVPAVAATMTTDADDSSASPSIAVPSLSAGSKRPRADQKPSDPSAAPAKRLRTLLAPTVAKATPAAVAVSAQQQQEEEDETGLAGTKEADLLEYRCAKARQVLRDHLHLGRETTRSTKALLAALPPAKVEEFWRWLRDTFSDGLYDLLHDELVVEETPRRFLFQGRLIGERCFMYEKKMETAAKGSQYYSYMEQTGRMTVDLMLYIKDNQKPKSNALKFCAPEFLGDDENVQKIDLPPERQFQLYEEGFVDPSKRWEIVEYCFPEEDHQILTNRGYMFLHQLEAVWGADINGPPTDPTLLIAGFDKASRTLVYERPSRLVVNAPQKDRTMIDFTQHAYRKQWEKHNAFGLTSGAVSSLMGDPPGRPSEISAGFSVVTTPDHDMYVQCGRVTKPHLSPIFTTGRIAKPIPFTKTKAADLIGDAAPRAIKFLSRAEGGLDTSRMDRSLWLSVKSQLGLTDDQVAPFLELYGYWLGDGSLQFNSSDTDWAVTFSPVKPADIRWLSATFELLALPWLFRPACSPEDMSDDAAASPPSKRRKYDKQVHIRIVEARYKSLFFSLYRNKYVAAKRINPSVCNTVAVARDAHGSFSAVTKSALQSYIAAGDTSALHSSVCDTSLAPLSEVFSADIGMKSAKWMAPWVWQLNGEEARAVLAGVRRADGAEASNANCIHTSSAPFRDELERLALHAGYAAHTTVSYLAGTVRTAPGGTHAYANHTSWRVRYPEDTQFSEPVLKREAGDVTATTYSGRTWCVTMPSTFIVVRRAKTVQGIVSHASKPVILHNCARDCDIPLLLILKLCYVDAWVCLSRVSSTPIQTICNGGQQIRVFNTLATFVHNKRVLHKEDSGWPKEAVNDADASVEQGTATGKTRASGRRKKAQYEGAAVLPPKSGYYNARKPVSTLDFASLYPTLMRVFNLCPSALIINHDHLALLAACPYAMVEKHTVRHTHEDGSTFLRDYYINMTEESITFQMLQMLVGERKKVKAQMAKADAANDAVMKQVYNKLQDAIKVICNATYGFFGTDSESGMMSCKPLAAITTSKGQAYIMATRGFIEATYEGSSVLYGDSVSNDTTVLLRSDDDGSVRLTRVDEIEGGVWQAYEGDKEQLLLAQPTSIWSDSGFTPVRKVIRHRLHEDKRMFRICTHTGIVDCTEDHSLVLDSGDAAKPKDVAVGTRLRHSDPVAALPVQPSCFITTDEAWAMGFFMADGSADVYECASGSKATWAINKANRSLLLEAQRKLPFPTKILDTLASSGVYKLVPSGGTSHVDVARKYRRMFYNSAREKIVPDCLLQAPLPVARAFWDGMYAGDGDHDPHGYTRIDQRGKQSSTGLFLLARRLGYSVSINQRADKTSIFRLTCTQRAQRKQPHAIKTMYELPASARPEFVYDFETESHHFHVGPGNLCVHNTDSVMVLWASDMDKWAAHRRGVDAAAAASMHLQHDTFKIGGAPQWRHVVEQMRKDAAEGRGVNGDDLATVVRRTRDFTVASKVIQLEPEKVYCPYLLTRTKKAYLGRKCEARDKDDESKGFKEKVEIKGLAAARRDVPQFIVNAGEEVAAALLDATTTEGVANAKAIIAKYITAVVKNTLPLADYVKSASLGTVYESDPPQVHVVTKMKARGEDDIPCAGMRVDFVIVEDKSQPSVSARAEHPDYVAKAGLAVDRSYYMSALEPSMSKMFADIDGEWVERAFKVAKERCEDAQGRASGDLGALISMSKAVTSGAGSALRSSMDLSCGLGLNRSHQQQGSSGSLTGSKRRLLQASSCKGGKDGKDGDSKDGLLEQRPAKIARTAEGSESSPSVSSASAPQHDADWLRTAMEAPVAQHAAAARSTKTVSLMSMLGKRKRHSDE